MVALGCRKARTSISCTPGPRRRAARRSVLSHDEARVVSLADALRSFARVGFRQGTFLRRNTNGHVGRRAVRERALVAKSAGAARDLVPLTTEGATHPCCPFARAGQTGRAILRNDTGLTDLTCPSHLAGSENGTIIPAALRVHSHVASRRSRSQIPGIDAQTASRSIEENGASSTSRFDWELLAGVRAIGNAAAHSAEGVQTAFRPVSAAQTCAQVELGTVARRRDQAPAVFRAFAEGARGGATGRGQCRPD